MQRTDKARIELKNFVKSFNGQRVQQKDVVSYLTSFNNGEFSIGVVRGILNKLDGIGGSYVPIPGILSEKENGSAYYKFLTEDSELESKNKMANQSLTTLSHILNEEVSKFEKSFKRLGIDIVALDESDTQLYFEFVQHLQALKRLCQ
jgi:hypothetical protein